MWVASQLIPLILPTASSQNQLGWNWRDFPGCVSHLLRLILSILGIFNARVSSRKSWLWEWCGATKRLDHRTGEKICQDLTVFLDQCSPKRNQVQRVLGKTRQACTQSPRTFWSAGERPERLWNNGPHFPRKRGVPVLVRFLEIWAEISVISQWRVEIEEWKS